jgi:hypothetical protein
LRSAIPCNVTIVKTVALVSCLARLHNFCIDWVERSKQHDKDILPLDLEHLMNGEVGCVQMVNITDSSYNVPIPRDIIESVITSMIVLELQGRVDKHKLLGLMNYHELHC